MISNTFTLSADLFEVNAGSDEHVATSWDILDGTTVVWSSYDDSVNLTSIEVPLSTIVAGRVYTGRVSYKGASFGWSARHTTPIMVSFEWDNKVVAVAKSDVTGQQTYSATIFSERAFSLLVTPPKGYPAAFTGSGHCTAFTPNGKMLLIGHSDLPYLSAYVRQRDAYVRINGVTPQGAVVGITCGSNDLIAYTTKTAPYIGLVKVVGDQLTNISTDVVLAGVGAGIAFSPDGKWLAVASLTSPQLSIFAVQDDGIQKVGDSGTTITVGHNPRAVEFNHDGSRVTVATTSVTYTFSVSDTGSLTRLTTGVISRAAATDIDFNRLGTHAVAAFQNSNRFEVYPVTNGALGTGVLLTSSPTSGQGVACRFSPDSQTLVVAFDTAPYVRMYKLYEGQYIPAISPTVSPTSGAYSCKLNADGTVLVVGMVSAPYLAFYRRDGDLFIRLSSPSVMPVADVRGIDIRGNVVLVAPDLLQYRITDDYKVVHETATVEYNNLGLIRSVDSHGIDGQVTTVIGSANTTAVFEDTENVRVLTKSEHLQQPFHPNATGAQTHAISGDGRYMAVATSSASPYVVTYERVADQFIEMGGMVPPPHTSVTSLEMNHDGSLMVITTAYMTVVYKHNGNHYALDTELGLQYNKEANLVSFSNTGKYLVVSTTTDTAVYETVEGNTRRQVFYTTEFTGTQVSVVRFTADDAFMVIVGQKAPYVFGYDTTDNFSPLVFQGSIPNPGANATWSASWSPTSNRLSVAVLRTAPAQSLYMFDLDRMSGSLVPVTSEILHTGTVYSRPGYPLALSNSHEPRLLSIRSYSDTDGMLFKQYNEDGKWSDVSLLTKAQGVSETVSEVCASDDGTWMVVRTTSSPYVALYKLDNGAYTRAQLPITVNSNATSVAISKSGQYIAITASYSPFVQILELNDQSTYEVSTIVTGSPKSSTHGITFSDDELTCIVTCRGTTDVPILHLRKTDSGWYGVSTAPTTGSNASFSSVAANKSGTRIICWSDESTNPRLYYYTKLPSGEYLLRQEWSVPNTIVQCLFSPDERDLIVLQGSGAPIVSLYQEDNNGQIVVNNNIPVISKEVYGTVHYNKAVYFGDGTLLAVTCEKYPYVITMKQTTDGYERVNHERVVGDVKGAKQLAIDPAGVYVALATSQSVVLLKREVNRYVAVEPLPIPANCVAFTPDGQSLIVGTSIAPFVELYTKQGGALVQMDPPAINPGSSVVSVAASVDNNVTISMVNPPYIAEYTYTPTQLTNYTPTDTPLMDSLELGWPAFITADFMVVFSKTTFNYTVYRLDNDTFYKHKTGTINSADSVKTILAVDYTTTATNPAVLLVTRTYAYVLGFSTTIGDFVTTRTIIQTAGGASSSHYLRSGAISPDGLRVALGRQCSWSSYRYSLDLSNAVVATIHTRSADNADFSYYGALPTPSILSWSQRPEGSLYYYFYYHVDVSALSFCTDTVLYYGVSYGGASGASRNNQLLRCENSGGSWNTTSITSPLTVWGTVASIDAIEVDGLEMTASVFHNRTGSAWLVFTKGANVTYTHGPSLTDFTATSQTTIGAHVKFNRMGTFVAVSQPTLYNGHQLYHHDATINVTTVARELGDGGFVGATAGACDFSHDGKYAFYIPFATDSYYNPRMYQRVSPYWYEEAGAASGAARRVCPMHSGKVIATITDNNGIDLLLRDEDGHLNRIEKPLALQQMPEVRNIKVNYGGDMLLVSTNRNVVVVRVELNGAVNYVLTASATGTLDLYPHSDFIQNTNDIIVAGMVNAGGAFRVGTIAYNSELDRYDPFVEVYASNLFTTVPPDERHPFEVGLTPDGEYLLNLTHKSGSLIPDVPLVVTQIRDSVYSVVYPLSVKKVIDLSAKVDDLSIVSQEQNAINRLTWDGVSLTPVAYYTASVNANIRLSRYEPNSEHLLFATSTAGRGWHRIDLVTGVQTIIAGSPAYTVGMEFNEAGTRIVSATSTGSQAYEYNAGALTTLPTTSYGTQSGKSVAYSSGLNQFFVTTSNYMRPLYGITVDNTITNDFTVVGGQSLTAPVYSASRDYTAVGMTGAPFLNVWYKNNLIANQTGMVVNTGTIDYLVFSPDEQVLVGVMNRTSGWSGSTYTALIQFKVTPTSLTVVDEVNFGSTQSGLALTIDPVTDELVIQFGSEMVGFYPRSGDRYDLSNLSSTSWTTGIRANNAIRHVEYDNRGDLIVLHESGNRLTKYRTNEERGSYSPSPLFATAESTIQDCVCSPSGTSLLTRYSTTITAHNVVDYKTVSPVGGRTFSGITNREYYKFIDDDQFIFGKTSTGNSWNMYVAKMDKQTNTVGTVTTSWDTTLKLATKGGLTAKTDGVVVYGLDGINSWSPIHSATWTGTNHIPSTEVRGDALAWTKGNDFSFALDEDKLVVAAHSQIVMSYTFTPEKVLVDRILANANLSQTGQMAIKDGVVVVQRTKSALPTIAYDITTGAVLTAPTITKSTTTSSLLAFNPSATLVAMLANDSQGIEVFSYDSTTKTFGASIKKISVSPPTINSGGLNWLDDDLIVLSGVSATVNLAVFSVSDAPLPVVDPMLNVRSKINKISRDGLTNGVFVSSTITGGPLDSTVGLVDVREMTWGMPIPIQSPASSVKAVALSDDKHWIAVATGTGHPYVWYRDGNEYKAIARGTTPTMSATCVDIQADKLFVSSTASPYAHVFSLDQSTNTVSYDGSLTPVTGAGNWIAAANDAKTVVVAHNTSPFMSVFKEEGGVWTKMLEPDIPAKANAQSCTISEDGKHVAITYATTPYLALYRINDNGSISDLSGLKETAGGLPGAVENTGHKISFGYKQP